MSDRKYWRCNTCGSWSTSTHRWCDRGCGSDYNQMGEISAEEHIAALEAEIDKLRGADKPWTSGMKLNRLQDENTELKAVLNRLVSYKEFRNIYGTQMENEIRAALEVKP